MSQKSKYICTCMLNLHIKSSKVSFKKIGIRVKFSKCHTERKNSCKIALSYDVSVMQWTTSCHENRMTTRVITLWRERVTSFTTSVSTVRFLFYKSENPILKGHMINRILHSWSFHMKFMELAECLFHKSHMKWPWV